MENNKKEARLIFNAGMARSLLRAGCTIVDVKADRDNKDKSVFAFKNDEHFQKEFERINNEIAATRSYDEVL
jgi:hypothetical protein